MDIQQILSGEAVKITGFDEESNPQIEVTSPCDERGNRTRIGGITLRGLSAHQKMACRSAWMEGARVEAIVKGVAHV